MADKAKKLMRYAITRTAPAEFTNQNVDIEEALRDELKPLVGTERLFRKNMNEVFDLMEESFNEVQPLDIKGSVGFFSEVVSVPNNTKQIFRIKNLNRQRGKAYVTQAAAAGVYETFRLDEDWFEISTIAIGGGGYVTFERYISGLDSIMDVYAILLQGFTDRIYDMIQGALNQSWYDVARPAANRVYLSEFDTDEMQKAVNIVNAYGRAIIYCTMEFASTMSNAITYATSPTTTNQKWSEADLMDIRSQGFIGVFHGTPIVLLPQSYTDVTNSKLSTNPRMAYVIPAGDEKLVKVVLEGDMHLRNRDGSDWGTTIEGYRKVGVGIVSKPVNWVMVYNAGIPSGGWDDIPDPNSP